MNRNRAVLAVLAVLATALASACGGQQAPGTYSSFEGALPTSAFAPLPSQMLRPGDSIELWSGELYRGTATIEARDSGIACEYRDEAQMVDRINGGRYHFALELTIDSTAGDSGYAYDIGDHSIFEFAEVRPDGSTAHKHPHSGELSTCLLDRSLLHYDAPPGTSVRGWLLFATEQQSGWLRWRPYNTFDPYLIEFEGREITAPPR